MNSLPDLKVRHKSTEGKARFDLRVFLYTRARTKSGQVLDSRWFLRRIDRENIKPDRMERLGLILEIKNNLENRLISGYSHKGVESCLATIQKFFDFFDQNGQTVTLENITESYLDFCENLFQLCHTKPQKLNKNTAYGYGSLMSTILGQILDLPVSTPLIHRTRLEYQSSPKKAVSRQADKQNLEDTMKMGGVLVDFVAGITVESVLGQLPLRIPVRNDLVKNNEITLSLGRLRVTTEGELSQPIEDLTWQQRVRVRRVSRNPVKSIEGTKRWAIVNCRITAEFLIFIAQTGMNLTEATTLKRKDLRYKPIGGNWQVKAFKSRRGGEVAFNIYQSYKPFLQEHLKFINHFFPESELLFPSFDHRGQLSKPGALAFRTLQSLLKKHGVPWIPPQVLRKTRVNWCLRRSGGDVALTAEMHQHLQETLRENYELPSQQRVNAELTRFWNDHDPIERGELKASVISGQCNGSPLPTEDKPADVAPPNCISQSGCLWCKNMRDIDSLEYVWSLTSFRHLKTYEAAGVTQRETIPADMVIGRITEKINWFRQSSNERAEWVDEAEIRVAEGDYHPHWSGMLEFLEE